MRSCPRLQSWQRVTKPEREPLSQCFLCPASLSAASQLPGKEYRIASAGRMTRFTKLMISMQMAMFTYLGS